MSIIHTNTRDYYNLTETAPGAVSSYDILTTPDDQALPVRLELTDGTDGADVIAARPGDTFVFGFGGDDIISNETSYAQLLGGAGDDTFLIYNTTFLGGFQDAKILDFEIGSDVVNLTNFEVSSFSDLTLTVDADGEFAEITHADSNLTLHLYAQSGLGALSASDFVFDGSSDSGGDDDTNDGADSGSEDTNDEAETESDILPSFNLPTLPEYTVDDVTLDPSEPNLSQPSGEFFIGLITDDIIISPSAEQEDVIFAAGGNDYVDGSGGNDVLYGGAVRVDPQDLADTLLGGAADDVIFGNGGNDILLGDENLNDTEGGNDHLLGGEGNDMLFGNGGNDRLNGQTGNDSMDGGVGDDVFVFGYASGNDVIANFQSGSDQLHILTGLNDSAIDSIAEVLQAVTYIEGAAVLDLGSGHNVTLLGVTELTEADVQIITDMGLPA